MCYPLRVWVWPYAREMPRRRTTHPPRALKADAEAAARELYAAMAEAGAGAVPCQIEGQRDLWTSEHREQLEQAAELCRDGCPQAIRGLCLDYANRSRASWGAWSGSVRGAIPA